MSRNSQEAIADGAESAKEKVGEGENREMTGHIVPHCVGLLLNTLTLPLSQV